MRHVAVVPHTHWDREWYLPFERFRLRLVELLDDLLVRLDADPSYAHFMLDGQMAVVDDDVALRPHHADMIRRLVTAGRLSVGPWYTLPDEFLVSAETLVRNLQLGLARAASYGGAMEIGYLPDMFGHVAQMPQLLRQFGFEHAVVWRGVPARIDTTGFWWEAPDGSRVRAEYLPTGYGNGARCPDDAKAFVERVQRWEEEQAARLGATPILWMNGADHQLPQPWLGRVIAEANDITSDAYRFDVMSLSDHLAAAPLGELPVWRGELRSGAHANVLMGVTSNRVDVRQAAARAERALERYAEPLCALFLPPDQWPAVELGAAWLEVIRNAAHDSVCACSVDEVCDAVLHRYATAWQLGEGLTERALRGVAAQSGAVGPVVVNPSARRRGGVVQITIPTADVPDGAQLVDALPADQHLWDVPARDALTIVTEMAAWEDGVFETRGHDGAVELVLRPGPSAERDTSRLQQAAASDPDTSIRVSRRRTPAARLLMRVDDVPGLGWAPCRPGTAAPVRVDGGRVSNGLVTVEVDERDGTFAIGGVNGLGRLVDGGDAGDTYNYCPPAQDRVVDAPDEVAVTIAHRGPVRASARVEAAFRWPASSTQYGRSQRLLATTVVTTLTLDAGDPFVRVDVEMNNSCRDHRLRAVFPLPEPAATSRAECAFGVVERGLTAEGGPTEAALATFPSRRFVQAGGLTVVHDGLPEYELVDIRDGTAHALALTLLRATGMLSRGPMSTRPLPAGPAIAVEGAQVLGRHHLRYAVAVGAVDPYAMADDAFVPLLVTTSRCQGTQPPAHGKLTVTGAQVSSVRRSDGGSIELRVFNASSVAATVDLDGRRGWRVDLRGRPIAPFDGSFDLGPWEIATAVLSE
jgi:alpha-mannosidase